MTIEPTTRCPTDETLAAFVEGGVDATTRLEVLAHIEHCSECMAAVLSANAHLAEARAAAQPQKSRSAWWLAVAAVVLIALVAVPLLRRRADPLERLVALAPRSARVVEPRLSGGFAWAPYRGPMRSGDAAADARRLKLGGVAGDAIEAAADDESNDAQHAAGIAMVLIDRPAEGMERLRVVAERSPQDARAWNDLAAARTAAAVQLERPSLLPEALAAADRAVRIDPRSAEALFNRALILEHLGVTGEARAAWERYLAVDATSPWAVEARQRLARLPVKSGAALFKDELPRLERAAIANDSATAASIVRRFPQQSRTWAEGEHLGLWGEAVGSGGESEATRLLTIARAIGAALAESSGESLLRDAVAAIDGADAPRRAALAQAHVVYRRGRMAYAKRRLDEGERDLRDAASRFTQAGSPMSFPARYFAASARYDRHEVTAARDELARLREEVDARTHFTAMQAQVRWALALCSMTDADWAAAVPLLEQSEAGFRALGERANLGSIETLAATTFTSMGRPDDAWAARIRAFGTLSAEGNDYRLTVGLGAAARNELRGGRRGPALAMLQLEEAVGRTAADDALLVDALVRQAVLHIALEDEPAASANVRDAEAALQRMRDPAMRAWAAADVSFAKGAIALRGEPARARQLLTTAIDAYRAQQLSVLLPESFLLRARAAMQLGDPAAAMRDLDEGIAVVERQRVEVTGSVGGTGVLDAGTALFEEAIRAQLERGDAAAAFAYAERARAQLGSKEGVDAATLQQRLAGTSAAVLELVVLPAEVVAFCVTSHGLTSTRTRVAREKIEKLAEGGELAALYELLIAPVALGEARQLIVVPDTRLKDVPFGALYDARAKRYLVQRLPVAIAPSAASLQRGEAGVAPALLAVALPSGNVIRAAALPELERELRDVAAMHGQSTTIGASDATFAAFAEAVPRAGLIHISGHTEREPGAGEPALLFAGEHVSWKRIARTPLSGEPAVVLAACETLRAPRNPQTHALSLGEAFLAAGAATVIGTLEPIADRDAREFFVAIHRELATGAEPANAVRSVQLAAIARGDRSASWQSIAVLTRRIPAGH